ncbi:pyridoxamine 5'-phosphate oxidase family protein [Sphingobium fuliginis]|jgi:general stress protein 26|uniref:General stress protein n=2 Tax=Sphingomonadaceae TaxID=41297 RepID=A0A292YVH5_SPHSA|nr:MULTISPECIES: pyridoxamine 5'-phosphate oxidase family protein [Sphingobium]MCB4859541.1 pyridoxamine 5'-phosphate oxidase family protein [Sphingobium sp. PNB]PNQ02145.1 pyridoxamine 5'-phosphate oxidase [Sphingobium sp. SA916]QOT71547.1 pyridoxamine 5'-phosphate oxidase family protein [Sphingobium fuliginis]GAY19652.1 general stress protein [Sphingobium fuliginis]
MMQLTLDSLAEKMKDIDFAMLSTHADGGQIGARPMSNNQDVAYGGDSFYFTTEDTLMVKDIERDPRVGLSFQGRTGLLKQNPLFIAVEGRADLIRDRDAFRAHWNSQLQDWFEEGPDTPGLVMIKVHAQRAHVWDGENEAELELG